MKLTITLSGKNKRYRHSISVRTLVSATVLSSIFMLVSSRSTESVSEDVARVRLAQSEVNETQQDVEALKQQTTIKLQTLISHIAELSAQASMLDDKGKQIATELGMTAADLDAFVPVSIPDNLQDDPLLSEINKLQQSLDVKSQQLSMLESLVRGHHIHEQSQLSGRPIASGWLSSYYGMRADPFTGETAMHKGLDFAGKAGDDVLATAAGIVTWAGERSGYGQLVEIEHGDGFITRYGHNETLTVSIGDVVTKGQSIAKMGNTGRSTGVHVHYEVIRNGKQIDPLPYVYKK
ncbi:M23 family metallopeptidase [Alteromonas stellipolaris]|jgi:murein DD-endopeptidase MepM/ murein hydrolase activator NlpD|uniref:M23 family metallopeptidase n=1 Tax=Alteromonas stellipolaris TaxID=233316 RepID=UPI00077052D4|nr:M23 family metallopeptidase [Alteromonas stellipolaris]AMJ95525.1 peptidase M23 [Alteromonas stellipolaris]ANB24657.1 peptidase M23 [Alteromonas stellipolaris]MBZ2163937.1 M23 family metallopeptidase [Alteromonas stellipolaris]MDO6540495.1 M23 family metallopeptidase [Alteromonas stellipolaris]MDP2536679.1 M23 family metallopeptidase [Alteromonas stellipolaris]